ncbi:pentatricopeptide repeat-containing protein At5g38730 [Impatiens glandulifera]|uniref:pentatricopeptide repeat-containing protein At5g38730 n=1 Tax=Impatiens glandulifera TaxID=253017 RepID=UPI001FB1903B|nr:pentatricopeptide repeat-containing protein At5g38730 [Impatiens glandulifera]
MASLISMRNEVPLVKALFAAILKGHWDNVLKAKVGSCVTSNTINQVLPFLSLYGFSLSLSFFKWVELVPGYKHSLQSNWTMIHILTKQRQYRTAQNLLEKIALRDFLSSPTVLNALSHTHDDQDSNSQVLSWLVIFYANSKMIRDSIQVFDHMRVNRLKPHLPACAVLLNSLVKDRLIDKVWKTYKKMINIGVNPNSQIFNVLINCCCKSKDVEKAEELISEMELKGIHPNLITFNTLISLYSKKGMHYEALSVQHRMEQAGISPDIVTYNSLIYGYCKEGRMREAFRFFKEINGATPNHVTYTTLIDGYCRVNDLNEALRLREEMEAKELFPGVVTYNSILRKLCEEGKINDANKLLSEMSQKKIDPDNVTCNTLINAYCKIGDMTSALRVKKKMSDAGLKPNQYTYRALIHGFCKIMDLDTAKEFLIDMIKEELRPGSCTYHWIVDGYCKKWKEGEEAVMGLLEEFGRKGICVDISIYRAIIRALCKRDRIGCAEKIFGVMNGKGILGDCVVCSSLAYAYFRGGNVAAASNIFEDMYRRRLMITPNIYRSLTTTYVDDDSVFGVFWDQLVARGLVSEIVQKQIQDLKIQS